MRLEMKKILLFIILALLPSLAHAQGVTVSGNLRDLGLNNVTATNSWVQFCLQNFSSNIPRVIGGGAIVAQCSPKFFPSASGAISGLIQSNDSITPANTFYRVCIYNTGVQFRCFNYLINYNPPGAPTWNLNTATPMSNTTVPPIGPWQVNALQTACTSTIPTTPPAGQTVNFVKCADGNPYWVDSSGTVHAFGSGSNVSPGSPNFSLQYNSGVNTFAGAPGLLTDGTNLHVKGVVPWVDGTQYGMRILSTFSPITVTTQNGNPSVNTTGVGDFIVNDGIVIPAAGAATSQSTPSAPSVTLIGATGSNSISYECKGIDNKWGMTAESAPTTITNAPEVFGTAATQISAISRSGTTVSGTTSTNMPFSSGTRHAVIANVTGGVVQFSGPQLVTVNSATSFSYTQSNQTESGTLNAGSYIIFKDIWIVTQAQATAGSNLVTLTTDTNHTIQFISSGSRPVRVYVDGIKFANATPTGYANGTFGVEAVTANTITITTGYTSPVTTTGTADAGSATSGVATMSVETWPVIDVACPALPSGTTQFYAIYANYGSGYSPIGFTPWGANIFEDYGPAFTQTGFVAPPAMSLPAAPTGTTQNQVYEGQITNINGNTLTVSPNVPTAVTGATAQHSNGSAFLAALAASCVTGYAPVYLPQPTSAFGYYLFSAPLDLGASCNRANILDGGALYLNGTIYGGSGIGHIEWKRPMDLAGFNNSSNGATNGGQTYVFGYAPPLMVTTGTSGKYSGLQFNTSSNGQIGFMVNGASNVEFTNVTFETAGNNNLSSLPLFIYNGGFGIQFHNIVFNGDKNWMYPVVDLQANAELGDPCYWPVPSIEMTGAFDPKFKMDGINYGIYRGIQFDALYPNTHTSGYVEISDVDTFQAAQQGLVNIYGSQNFIDELKITRSVMDSVLQPLVACITSNSGRCGITFVDEWSTNNGAGSLLSGAPFAQEIDFPWSGGPSAQNTNSWMFAPFTGVVSSMNITGSGSLLISGTKDGLAPVNITTANSCTLGTSSAGCAGSFVTGYSFNENATAGQAVTYTLPTAQAGKQYCVSNAYNGSAANTGVLTIATSASGQFIIFTDGTLSATGGNVTSGGAAADSACVVGVDGTHWQLFVQSGTWTKH